MDLLEPGKRLKLNLLFATLFLGSGESSTFPFGVILTHCKKTLMCQCLLTKDDTVWIYELMQEVEGSQMTVNGPRTKHYRKKTVLAIERMNEHILKFFFIQRLLSLYPQGQTVLFYYTLWLTKKVALDNV